MLLIDQALNLMRANDDERKAIMKYCIFNMPYDDLMPIKKKQFRAVRARLYYMLNYEIVVTASDSSGQKDRADKRQNQKQTNPRNVSNIKPKEKTKYERESGKNTGNNTKACNVGFSKLPKAEKGINGADECPITAAKSKSSIRRERPNYRMPANGKPGPPAGE